MKKIIYLLALCICLNGMGVLAEGVDTPAPGIVERGGEPSLGGGNEDPNSGGEGGQQTGDTEGTGQGSDSGETTGGETTEGQTTGGEATEGQTTGGEATGGDSTDPTDPTDTTPTDGQETPAGDALPADAEAWIETDAGRAGGKLADVLAGLRGGETVYLRADGKKPAFVKDAPRKLLSEIQLLPDGDAFKGKGYVVRLSEDDPTAVETPAFLDVADFAGLSDTDVADLYLWVEKEAAVPGEPEEPEDPAPTQPALTVSAEGLNSGEWSGTMPVFTLSGIPEDKNWSYAAIIFDERIAVLSGDTYAPEAEGVYTVRLAMLDEIGDIVDASEKYTLMLDCTPPESVQVESSASKDYALDITASDAMSGVVEVSVDGGQTWTPLSDGETWTYAAEKAGKLKAGMLQVRDAAGNVWASEEDYALAKREKGHGGYGGGGGGGGGSGTPAKQHARNEKKDTGDYEVMKMQLPEEPMARLTVDGEPLALTLALTAAEEPEAPVGEEQTFMATLETWFAEPEEGEDAPAGKAVQPDTLVLTAEAAENLGDRFTYEWRFNGEVYRALANSGIRYVALRVGDDIAAFSTEGFLAGTKYTELKMQGVSTRKFEYALAMQANLDPAHLTATSEVDFSQTCDLAVRAEVEDMAYELGSSPQSVMYFCDLYLGPVDMLAHPFGGYVPADAQAVSLPSHGQGGKP